MPYEFDHLFIYTAAGAPEAQALIDFGLHEGAPRRHPGQGTANRRFFFANAFIELLYVADEAEAAEPTGAAIHALDRWQGRGTVASPFGVGLRPTDPASEEAVPYPAWRFRPPYLPGSMHIDVGENIAHLHEPMVFSLAFGAPPASLASPPPLDHPAGLTAISGVEICGLWETRSATLAACAQTGAATFRRGKAHHAMVTFDDGAAGKTHDFSPTLPLTFRW